MTPILNIRLLGEFGLFFDNKPIFSVERPRQQALLAYLLLHRHTPQPRQKIAFTFWPDSPESQAHTNLRKLFFQLRQVLPQADVFLKSDSRHLYWQHDAPYRLDVAELERGLELLKRAGTPDTATVEQIVTLYGGELLPTCYDDWLLSMRRALHERVVNTLVQALIGLGAQHEYVAALHAAEHLRMLDPLHEEIYRHVMHLRTQIGDRAGALRVYHECVAVLKRELDIEPVSATTALYQELLKWNSDPQGKNDAPASLTPPQYIPVKPKHNLPLQLTPMIGREHELAALEQLLSAEGIRLVTIAGPGGIGKTRLALEAARRQLDAGEKSLGDTFAHGVHFVALAPLNEPNQIVPALAEAIGLTLESSGASILSPTQQVLDYLRGKQMLLVLDNFEQLLNGVALIYTILQTAPRIHILVTSRERLSMPGEQLYWLHGLDTGQSEEWVGDDGPAAVTLFTQTARRSLPQLTLSKGDLRAIFRICRLVEGMPLAIELAAGWIDTLSPAAILQELQHGFDFLAAERRGVPERHQSMRAVFDVTWQRLDEKERTVFAALSVFRGGFSREGAQAVTGATLRQLSSLTGKSLIVYHPHRSRYTLHELLRQYAALRLAEQAEVEKAVRDRHSLYYAAFLQQYQAALKGIGQRTALTALDSEHENVSLMWRWFVDQGNVGQLAQTINGLGLYFQLRRLGDEGLALFQVAAQRVEPTAETRLLAQLLSWQAAFACMVEQFELAAQLLARSLRLLDSQPLLQQDVRAERAFVLSLMGALAFAQGDYHERQYYDESAALFEELEDASSAAGVLRGLLEMTRALGDFSTSRELAQRSLTLYSKVGNERGMANARLSLASCEIFLGRPEIALGEIPQSLAVFLELRDREGIWASQFDFGHAYLTLGEFSKARQALLQCAAISIELGSQRMESLIYNVLCGVEMGAGDYALAYGYAQRSLEVLAEEENHPLAGVCSSYQGWAALYLDTSEDGLEVLQKSVVTLDKVGGIADRCWAYALLALGEWMNNLPCQARSHCLYALRLGRQCAERLPVSVTLSLAMALLADGEDILYALELYGMLRHDPYCNSAAWWRDSVGQHVEARLAHLLDEPLADEPLADEVVKAALQHGGEVDVWETVDRLVDILCTLGWETPS